MVLAQYKQRLLDEFEQRTDAWSFRQFESRLCELRKGASYHDAKWIIIEADKLGKWPNTVKRYLCTNFATHGNVSCELSSTFSPICDAMSESEKKSWGFRS